MAEIITYSGRHAIDARTILVFDHIPKCAGTSFESWLTSACGGKRVYAHCYADYVNLKRLGIYDFKVIVDHYTWGTHCFLPADLSVAYLTMIRDPLNTAISMYNFTRNQFFGEYSTDINSYLLDYPPNYFVNHFGQGDLIAAKNKLFETYVAFGIVEHYQHSLDIIVGTFGFESVFQATEKRNVSQTIKHEISGEVREVFKAENAKDYALYAAAEREFATRLEGVERVTRKKACEASVSECVAFTGTLPDVRACLDAKEYEKALSLLGEKHVESLPRHMLLFAGQLAQKLGEIGKARELYEKMQSSYAHTYTDYYVGFLLSIGERAKAVELIDAELELLHSDTWTPCDTKFFEYTVRYHCLVIVACWGEAQDRAETSIRLLAAYSDVSELAFVALLNVLRDVGAYARALEVYRDFEHVVRNQPAAIYAVMITTCYQGGMFQEAQDFCYRLLAISPYNQHAICTLIVMDRKSGRFELDLEPYEELARRLEGTVQASSILREVAMHHYENKNSSKGFAMAKLSPDATSFGILDTVSRNNEFVSFNSANVNDVLVIKSGPNIVFDCLYKEFLHDTGKMFEVVGAKNGLSIDAYPMICGYSEFPGTRYVHDYHCNAILTQLRKKKYEDCIVIMSEFNMLSYGEILKLASEVSARNIYIYSLNHVLSGKYQKTLLKLSPGTGQVLQ